MDNFLQKEPLRFNLSFVLSVWCCAVDSNDGTGVDGTGNDDGGDDDGGGDGGGGDDGGDDGGDG